MSLFDVLRRARRVLGDGSRWPWIGLVALSAGVAALEAVGAVLVLTLVRTIVTPEAAVTLPLLGDLADRWPTAQHDDLRLAVSLAVVAFFVLRSVVFVGQGYLRARMVERTSARLSDHLLRGYLALDYLTHTKVNSATLVRNAYVATQQFGGQVLRPLVSIAAELVVVGVLAVVLVVLAPGATLVAAGIFAVTVTVLLKIIQPRLRSLGREAQDARSVGLLAITQALTGFRDIRLAGAEDHFANRYQVERDRIARADSLRSATSEMPRALIETTLVIVIVLLLALSEGGDVAADAGLVPTLGVFAYIGLRMQPSLTKIVDSLNQLKFGAAVLDDLHDDRVLADEALAGRAVALQQQGPTFTTDLEVEGGRLTYPGTTSPALDGIDLRIRAGTFVGICGPTGGGKSTLLDVLVGLLTLDEGEVRVDGQALGQHPRWWQAQLGVVSQSIFLTDDTLRANIAFGVDRDKVDRTLLLDCVRRAQLDDVVAGLPDGLDTIVGERGLRLSGGQRQRVAIARALYTDPAVIIMDEGTSALDAATESALVAALGELRANRTLIAVAHRIATVLEADEIHVIADGRIIASGDHGTLLANNDLFRTLVAGR